MSVSRQLAKALGLTLALLTPIACDRSEQLTEVDTRDARGPQTPGGKAGLNAALVPWLAADEVRAAAGGRQLTMEDDLLRIEAEAPGLEVSSLILRRSN